MKIVDAGSISRAAAQVFVAQPALSHQIAELEDEIGVVLLHRSARGVRPTAAGEVLYTEAVEILQRVGRLQERVLQTGLGEPAGTVSLGMSSVLAAMLAAPFMEACKAALPRVALSFVSEDSLSLKARIVAHTLDIAVVFESEPMPGVIRRPLFRQRFFLVGRKPPAGSPASVSLEALARMPLVMPNLQNGVRKQFDRLFAAAGLAPTIAMETNVLSTMLTAAQAGVGATVLPIGAIPATSTHEEWVLTPIEPPIFQTACIVSSDSTNLSVAGEAACDLLSRCVNEILGGTPPPGMEGLTP